MPVELCSDLLRELRAPKFPLFDGVTAVETLVKTLGWNGRLEHERTFSEGKSGSAVMAVRLKRPGKSAHRRILKVGPSADIIDELQNYQALREHIQAKGLYVELVELEKTKEVAGLFSTTEAAALFYESAGVYAGATGEVESLLSLLDRFVKSGKKWRLCQRILQRVIDNLPDHGSEVTEEIALKMEQFYTRKWFPNFRATVSAGSFAESKSVSLGDASIPGSNPIDHGRLRAESESEDGLPKRFRVAQLQMGWQRSERVYQNERAVDRFKIRLETQHLTAQLDVEGALDQVIYPGDKLYEVGVSSSVTRWGMYQKQIEPTFGRAVLTATRLHIGTERMSVANPFRTLSRGFHNPQREWVHFGPGHGDLHPGNILIVEETPIIIDFGLSSAEVPVGSDFIRLFACIARDAASSLELSSKNLQNMLICVFNPDVALSFSGPETHALKLLKWLWQIGKARYQDHYLAEQLFGFAMVSLKWQSKSPDSQMAGIVLASLALREMNIVGETEGGAVDLEVLARTNAQRLSREDIYMYLFDRLHFSPTALECLKTLPAAIGTMTEVCDVIKKLMESYLGTDWGLSETRIYYAYRETEPALNTAVVYKIGISTSEHKSWRVGIEAGKGSNVHTVYTSRKANIIADTASPDAGRHDKLSDEKAVAAFPVTIRESDECIGVIGISSATSWSTSEVAQMKKIKAFGQEMCLVCGAFFQAFEQGRPPATPESTGPIAKVRRLRREVQKHFSAVQQSRLTSP